MRRQIPHLLTGLRVLLLPLFLYLLTRVAGAEASASAGPRAGAAAVLLVMGLTDTLDGWLARRLNAESRIGAVADAVADRLTLLIPLLYFAIARPTGFPDVPVWIPAWLVGLDLVVSTAWLAARRWGVQPPIHHNMAGRVSVWVMFGLLLWIVLGLPAAGVRALALLGLGLITFSVATYLHRWLA
jgi:cardiolipin synthase (CMP-forming)